MAFAQCAQIATWSQSDFNPTLYPNVIAVNGPGKPPGSQSTGLATYIAAVPVPAGVKTLTNNSAITIYSFASAADAQAYYGDRRSRTVLPTVYEQAGKVSIVSTSLKQGAVADLYLDAVYLSTVILVAGYADTGQTMASGSGVSLYLGFLSQAQSLVDAKCAGQPQPNHPPTLSMSPDPAVVPDFQEVMTQGLEFEIRMDDIDGVDDIDLGRFQVWVAGVDQTRHFLETAAAHPSRLRQTVTATGRSFHFRPNPEGLMTDFNYFNIQWNGNWPISIGICDRHNACVRTNYTIYFGPYLAPTATFLGGGGNCVGSDNKLRFWFILGNSGHASANTSIYFGLLRPSDGSFWTYAPIGNGLFKWRWREILPALTWPSLPSGYRFSPLDQLVLPLEAYPVSRPITNGTYQLVLLPLDANSTDNFLVSKPATLCPP